MKLFDVIIIGGGQAGLSVGYFMKKTNLNYLILDDQIEVTGSWNKTWEGLKLFSPTEFSSLSGWQMPKSENECPSRIEFINYLKAYQKRYNFNSKKDTKVIQVSKQNDVFKIETTKETYYSKKVVSATGTAGNKNIPKYVHKKLFKGKQIHSIEYKNSDRYKEKNVLIVGGGNSGAQILAEVSTVAQTKWVTLKEPHFLADDIDGRYLFNQANTDFRNKENIPISENASLSNIVMIDSVKEARHRGVLNAVRPFKSFYEDGVIWNNGTKEKFDEIIWCTGFKPNIDHLLPLNIIKNNKIETHNTRSILEPNLWLVGYGNWTGFASATIYGVGKTARQTVKEIIESF